MSAVPANLRYRESHEWIDPATGVVGVTDHAQHELTDVVFVELPKVGAKGKAADNAAVVERAKPASAIYAPVTGKAGKGNRQLRDIPSLIKTIRTAPGG